MASQVAKRLVEKRKKIIREGIIRKAITKSFIDNVHLMLVKIDTDRDGKISLTEYFGIFEEHGLRVSSAEAEKWVSEHLAVIILINPGSSR